MNVHRSLSPGLIGALLVSASALTACGGGSTTTVTDQANSAQPDESGGSTAATQTARVLVDEYASQPIQSFSIDPVTGAAIIVSAAPSEVAKATTPAATTTTTASSTTKAATASIKLSNLPAATTTSTSASIGHTLTGSGTVLCRRDSFTPVDCPNPFNLGKSAPLAAGSHRVDYYVDSGSGYNLSAPAASYAWTITEAAAATSSSTTSAAAPAPVSAPTTTATTSAQTTSTSASSSSSSSSSSSASPLAKPAISYIEAAGQDQAWSGSTIYGSDGDVRFGQVSDPAGSGKSVNIHSVVQGDSKIYNGFRSEISYTKNSEYVNNDEDQWMAFAVYLTSAWPTGGTDRSDRMSVFQVHQRSDSCDNDNGVPLQLQSWGQDGTLRWIIGASSDSCSSESTNTVTQLHVEPVRLNQWIKYVMHYRPAYSSSDSPRLRIWRDGTLIVDSYDANAFNNSEPAWPKLGIYHWNNTWAPTTRTMYTRGLYFGRGSNLLDAANAALN